MLQSLETMIRLHPMMYRKTKRFMTTALLLEIDLKMDLTTLTTTMEFQVLSILI